MSALPPGRRTESLFDNRYRYDHIYPRGRSGETLHAYDTHDHDRTVVIKRPAPQDAPPMRAGQEVSIRIEKQALERLSGHPILTELRGSGTFRVGGNTHEYIVMDFAEGDIVEELVFSLAGHNTYLPELETLVIIDHLLSLLAHAHDRQVIYNDVDAKHLFWDRDSYQLKVIDWGNAVFLDEPGAQTSVTRSTDIFQCGELLYFILTGGNRLAVEKEDSGDTFFVNFGPAAERIPARLQAIVTRAVNPDPKQRYGSIAEMRAVLREYRTPLERQRDEIVSRVRKRVRPTASQDELEELRDVLQDALDMDPGYPEANTLAHDIARYLGQIHFQADLDAIRIYMESGNWSRALALLHDLQPHADPANQPLLKFLIAGTAILDNLNITPPPNGFLDALDPLFAGRAPQAGHILLTANENRRQARQAQWLLAEQLAVHMPDVALLRPHLTRLRHELEALPDADALVALVDQAESDLNMPPLAGLTGLRILYQQCLDTLERLESAIDAASDNYTPEEHNALLTCVIRARRAANDILTQLDAVGKTVYSDPSQAGEVLRRAVQIDPTATHFNALHDYFDEVHQAITALAQFRPRSNGENLAGWFADVQDFIHPYLDDLADPQLHAAAHALQQAATGWTTAINALALGRRNPAIDALRRTADTIRPVNEQIAAWLGTLANRLPDVAFTEQLSPNEALAEKLIDGWKAWDRGDGIHATQLARDAYQLATTDGERLAATRLRRMGELLDNWASAGGYEHPEQTDQAETEALSILLAEEEHERQTFAEQMPNTDLYLRAMRRGIVAYMQQSSSAGWRALYMHYVLRGMLALFEDQIVEAEFWREVANKSNDSARTHRAFALLDRTLTSRVLIQKAQRALNAVTRASDLDAVRQTLNVPLAGDILADIEQAVQLINEALRSWSDGNFYDARQALDSALAHIENAAAEHHLAIDSFTTWVTELRNDAADLQQLRLSIEQNAATTKPDVDPTIAKAHEQIVHITQRRLGPDYVHQVRQWDDMYRAVLETYTSQYMSRAEKLAAFSRHFASLFIARHPAYPLFRHWEAIIEQIPPDTVEDTPSSPDSEEIEAAPPLHDVAYLDDDLTPEPLTNYRAEGPRELPWNWIIALTVIALIVIIGYAVLRSINQDGADTSPTATQSASANSTTAANLTAAAVILVPTETTTALPATVTQEPTLTPTATPTPYAIPTTPAATATDIPLPSETPTLFVTSTLLPTNTPLPVTETPVVVEMPTEEPGDSDVLTALSRLPEAERPGPAEAFSPGDAAWVLSTTNVDSTELRLTLSPELISTLFQPGASSALRQADATLELASASPDALAQGSVAFGLGAANADGEETIVQVQLSGASFVRLGLNQNGRFISSTEFPQQNPQFALSIRRTNTNTLSFYVDDRWLGDSVFLFRQGEPLTLILYAAGSDVLVNVSAFEIDFSPRDEIP